MAPVVSGARERVHGGIHRMGRPPLVRQHAVWAHVTSVLLHCLMYSIGDHIISLWTGSLPCGIQYDSSMMMCSVVLVVCSAVFVCGVVCSVMLVVHCV